MTPYVFHTHFDRMKHTFITRYNLINISLAFGIYLFKLKMYLSLILGQVMQSPKGYSRNIKLCGTDICFQHPPPPPPQAQFCIMDYIHHP